MLFRALHRMGVPSDLFYMASLGSIGASVVAWSSRRGRNAANAERLGIFIGLWAPTFMLIGQGLQQLEVKHGLGSPTLEMAARTLEEAAGNARRRAGAVAGR
jgi:hypothetical protein